MVVASSVFSQQSHKPLFETIKVAFGRRLLRKKSSLTYAAEDDILPLVKNYLDKVREYTFPGFIDVHVHFRDPGMTNAETIASGLKSARRGGFGAVVTMPNTNPACDSPKLLRYQVENSQLENSQFENSKITLFPSACITRGRLGKEVADLEALAEAGAAFFTDDGTYVHDDKVMEEAMRRIADLNMVVSQHALAPDVTEAEAITRDLKLCRETGCRLHIQHISTAKGVELVRSAQREGLPVTAEATPHHLLLTREDIPAGPDGGNFKMAPPLAGREDRAEVRKGVKDGVLMFATDHAPHPAATKNCGYEKSANGIIGLETAIPITYQVMVEEEGMSIEDWAKAWYDLPRALIHQFSIRNSQFENSKIDLSPTVIRVGEKRRVEVNNFASLSRNCPYNGMEFNCWPIV